MFSWRIFSSSSAYLRQGAGDRTPLRGPFSPRQHPSSFVILCEPGIVRLGGGGVAMGVFMPRHPVG